MQRGACLHPRMVKNLVYVHAEHLQTCMFAMREVCMGVIWGACWKPRGFDGVVLDSVNQECTRILQTAHGGTETYVQLMILGHIRPSFTDVTVPADPPCYVHKPRLFV